MVALRYWVNFKRKHATEPVVGFHACTSAIAETHVGFPWVFSEIVVTTRTISRQFIVVTSEESNSLKHWRIYQVRAFPFAAPAIWSGVVHSPKNTAAHLDTNY